jgi:hypothetical protein
LEHQPSLDSDTIQEVATCSFVDITQAPPDVARHFLEAYGWNVELAVAGYLEHGGQQHPFHGTLNGAEKEQQGEKEQQEEVVVVDDDPAGGDDDDSCEQLMTLASHRSGRVSGPGDTREGRTTRGVDDDEDSDEDDMDDDDEDLYGEEEDRFKYGRRTRRGHRRSMRRMAREQSRQRLEEEEGGVPHAVLSLPDVNLEEQKMLMAAMTGQAYDGEIPDFTNYVPYMPKPLSPGAAERQRLREEQDLAFQESLEMDKERQRREELALIEQLERKESERLERQALVDQLEEKRRRLPAEPLPEDPVARTLVVRLPSGLRLKRRFSKVDSISSVFDFVDVQEDTELRPGSYQLLTNFPRRVFRADDTRSMEELGFSSQEALFVEPADSVL